MKITILGTVWEIVEETAENDSRLDDCDGYCDWTVKKIVICRGIMGNLADMEVYIKKVKRHEITHAFLIESGLNECSGPVNDSWAMNETMVDWFARQGEKIYKAWLEADAV